MWPSRRWRWASATEWTGPSQHFDWKAQTDVFESLTSIRGWSASVAGGGLLLRTFVALQRVDLGFDPANVLTGFVLPPTAQYRTDAARLAFYESLRARIEALPGVTHAAMSSIVPLGGDGDTNFLICWQPSHSWRPGCRHDGRHASTPWWRCG